MSELFTLDTLQEFFAKRPKGAKAQCQCPHGCWETMNGTPRVGDVMNYWRWEPQSKSIDLSSLVGSDALCEFGVGTTCYGFLHKITPDFLFISEDLTAWKQCKPVMDKWMAVDRDMFIPEGLECTVVYAGGLLNEIKMVKFIGLKEGYHWPWEDK